MVEMLATLPHVLKVNATTAWMSDADACACMLAA
jgi:hypothetical protein